MMPQSSQMLSVLFEANKCSRWRAVRIIVVPNVRTALGALPVFARQQMVSLDYARVKVLRSEAEVLAAEEAVIENRRGPWPEGLRDE